MRDLEILCIDAICRHRDRHNNKKEARAVIEFLGRKRENHEPSSVLLLPPHGPVHTDP